MFINKDLEERDMNTIKDIRIYRSQAENIAGNSLPHEFANKELSIMLHRIAMKLRVISTTYMSI